MPLARYTCFDVLLQDTHVGEVPIPLREVEPVPDDEAIRDLETDVADGNVDLAALRLRQECADLERGGPARPEVAHQVREREPRVDDVLHDEDVAVLERDVEVLEDADDPRRVARSPVAGDGHEVDLAGDRQLAHEVGHEEDRALEDADEQEVAP